MTNIISGEPVNERMPTNCFQLFDMITREWPKVLESQRAVEALNLETMELIDLDFDDGSPSRIFMAHKVIRSCGPEIEGTACADPQLFFTEEQAVRAAWYQYNKLTPAKDFITDNEGVVLVWRNKPSIDERFGTVSVRMRYSVVYKDRFGVFKATGGQI